MGLLMSRLYELVTKTFANDPTRVLMVGLDAAGKTTILYKVKLNETVTTIPTIGFNVETVDIGKGINFTVWDVGGQDKIRRLWRHYYQNTEGLIFVVDSADPSRFSEARDELYGVLQDANMANVPVVIMANKQDMPGIVFLDNKATGSVTGSDLIDSFCLRDITGHPWYVQPTVATTGDGVYEGLFKMAEMIKDFRKMKRSGYF